MIYDMRMHLPQLMNKMLVDDMREADVDKLKTDVMLIGKLFKGNSFEVKLKSIDNIKKTRKKESEQKLINGIRKACMQGEIEDVLVNIDKCKLDYVTDLEKHERDYWETVVAEIIKINDSMVVEDGETV